MLRSKGIMSKNWPKSFLAENPRWKMCGFFCPDTWDVSSLPPSASGKWVGESLGFPELVILVTNPGSIPTTPPFWLSLMIFFHGFLTQNWRIFRLLCNAFNGSSSPSTSGILQRSLERVYVGLYEDWDPLPSWEKIWEKNPTFLGISGPQWFGLILDVHSLVFEGCKTCFSFKNNLVSSGTGCRIFIQVNHISYEPRKKMLAWLTYII